MEILFEDRDIVVCVKPAGLDSEHELPAALGNSIYTVHRLDKNVGGVMVYAKNKEAAAELSKQIQNGQMVKEYFALVEGTPPEEGVLEDLLFKDSKKNKVFVVDRQRAGVKAAKLAYKRLTAGERSLVRVRLYTGRSHQIRVQFASRGFPLVGDKKYGARGKEKEIGLFSCCLTFEHKGKICVYSAIPQWAALHENL